MGSCGSKGDNPKNKTFLLQTCDDHTGGVNCMAISEDGSVLVTGSEDKTARLWSTKTEKVQCIGILTGHEDYINCIAVEDAFVLTGSADKSIRKWDMATCDCVLVLNGHQSLINRIICTGDFIFTSSYDRSARCWDFDTGECIRVFNGHKKGVYPLIFIPADSEDLNPQNFDWDGQKDILVTGSADFTARSWSFETGKTINIFKGHEGAITCMATDPTGRMLFTGGTDHTIRSWNILKGDLVKVFEGHSGSVICMTVVNKILYSGSSDHTGRSWVTEFGDCTRVYRGHKHTVSCIRFNDGITITGCGDGIIRCFDAKSGSVQRTLKGHETGANCMQVVGGRLFSGSHDCTLRVWDITGMKDDVTFGREDKEEKKKDEKVEVDKNQNDLENGTKIMIEDEGPTQSSMNGGATITNGGFGGDMADAKKEKHMIDLV